MSKERKKKEASSPVMDIKRNTAPKLPGSLGSAIGPRTLLELVSCPCPCQQSFDDKHKTQSVSNLSNKHMASIESFDSSHEVDTEDEDEDSELRLPDVIEEGVTYKPTRILVEGWLHKKGTGKDWLGSLSWKARWTRLVMAEVDNCDVDIPLLMIYWYNTSPTPSTLISLESTVVLSVDLPKKGTWDAFQFEIRTVKAATAGNRSRQITRTFTAPRKARDAWVYAISQNLLVYEKKNALAKARKAAKIDIRMKHQQGLERPGDRFMAASYPSHLVSISQPNLPISPRTCRLSTNLSTRSPRNPLPSPRNIPRPRTKRPTLRQGTITDRIL